MSCFSFERAHNKQSYFEHFRMEVKTTNFPSLSFLITDCAPALAGHTNGFIAACKQSEYFPYLVVNMIFNCCIYPPKPKCSYRTWDELATHSGMYPALGHMQLGRLLQPTCDPKRDNAVNK